MELLNRMPWREQLLQQQQQRRSDSLWRELRTVQSSASPTIDVGDRTLLNFCSNNYLSLAADRRLVEAAGIAAGQFGVGTSASHLIVGHTEKHQQLERKIASFVGAEKAILFSTGYMANLAVASTLLGRNDLLLQDRLNHASIIDAGKLSSAKVRRYRHGDADHAASMLKQRTDHAAANRVMIATDGVFSMDGDVAPLADLRSVCQRHDAMLLVDDAHGIGVLGSGRGSLAAAGIDVGGNVLLLGTLSKALGSFGAFVAGDAVLTDHLIQFARPFIYTTALPCPVVAASLAAVKILESEPQRVERLHRNIRDFRDQAIAAGLPITQSATPIQPLIVGESNAAMRLGQHLEQEGILAVAIRPPTVPAGAARIRITLMADHTQQQIERLIRSLKVNTS